jgi:hypothetical protein
MAPLPSGIGLKILAFTLGAQHSVHLDLAQVQASLLVDQVEHQPWLVPQQPAATLPVFSICFKCFVDWRTRFGTTAMVAAQAAHQ